VTAPRRACPPPGAGLATAGPATSDVHYLLRLLVTLQERERRHLAELLHDGPMQEFTAVLLALGRMRKIVTGDVAHQLTAIETQLLHTVQSLQRPPSPFRPGNDARTMIEAALLQRVDGMLAEVLDIDIDVEARSPSPAELPVLVAVVQLLLLTSEPTGRAARVSVAVRSDAATAALTLTVRAAPGNPGIDGTEARASQLRRLAHAVGAEVECDPDSGAWRATLNFPAPPDHNLRGP
jgi:signal transduction histidine kinase